MSTLEPASSQSQENLDYNNINTLSSHKYNLFQQFFVVGLDPKITYNLYKIDIKQIPSELLFPNVISKFPNISLPYLNIPDSFVASHCFPNGILDKVINYKDEELDYKIKQVEGFVFSLDNLALEDNDSSLRTNKVYYNCLLFYEKIENISNLAKHRRKMTFKTEKNVDEEKNKNLLIPKVICLSSFSPLFMNVEQILSLIKKYCDNYNFEASSNKDNFYPIENFIEEIIYDLPGLPRGQFTIRLNYDAFFEAEENSKENKDNTPNNNNNNETNKKMEIIFEESQINKCPRIISNYSLLLTFFTVEEIFDIIKSIILEEPILFFSDNISYLTHTIEGILALIYPLTYQYPVVSVLPEENFSLINVFYHFIFGINYKYSEELWKQKFDYLGDKSKIVIIPIERRFPNFLNELDKEKNQDSIIINKTPDPQKPLVQLAKLNTYKNNKSTDKKVIKLPAHYSSKCIKRLGTLISTKMKEEKTKKKRDLSEKEKDQICNKEIIENFLYFFTCILINYQDFIKVKYERIKTQVSNKGSFDLIDNKLKRPEDIENKYLYHELKINDMFNTAGFIANIAALDRPFYEKFIKTQVFYTFIKKKLFPISTLDKIDVLYFDEKIKEKLSREKKKIKVTKFLEDKIETISGDINIDLMKKEISDETKEFLSNEHNCEKSLNYFQYIIKDNNQDKNKKLGRPYESVDENSQGQNITEKNLPDFKFYYFVFPKLLNDGLFYHDRKKGIKDEKNSAKYNSSCFYKVFEEEALKIVNNPLMSANYKTYSYCLNPISPNTPNHIQYIKAVNELWLNLLAKTFYIIPNNKKWYYFDQIIQFLSLNEQTIETNTLILLFNIINKYGDKRMNQDYFVSFSGRKKTYTSFLLLREKMKKKNNYIDYYSCVDKDIKIEDKFLFIINSFCTKVEENKAEGNQEKLYNICGEPNSIDISSMFNEKDKYINFECNKESSKFPKRQALIVSCFYEKGEGQGLRYQINFRLISPSYILKQKWFSNTENLDINFMRREYLNCYLSAIFYFHQQGLVFDFLLPKESTKNNLLIESISSDMHLVNTEIKTDLKKEEKKDEKKEEIKEEKKEEGKKEEKKEEEKKEVEEIKEETIKKEEKLEDKKNKIFMSYNFGLDLGGQNMEFCVSPPDSQKKSKSPKKTSLKKTTTITVGEFKLNMEDKK